MGLPSIALRFAGFDVLQDAIEDILNAANEQKKRGNWYVASVVEYAEILEWNTPHWRVAVQSLADEVELSTKDQQDMLNAMIAGGNLTKVMAQRLAARIRRYIREFGLVDTGNYLNSIAIGPSLGDALLQSRSQLLDPETAIFVVL